MSPKLIVTSPPDTAFVFLIYEEKKPMSIKYKTFNLMQKKVSKIYICLGFLIKDLWIEILMWHLSVSYRKSSLFYSLASNTVTCCTSLVS